MCNFPKQNRNQLRLSRQKIKKNSSSRQCTSRPNNNQGSQSLSESLAWGINPWLSRKSPADSAPWNWMKPPFVAATSGEAQRVCATAALLNDRGLQQLQHSSHPQQNPRKLSAYSWLGLCPFSECPSTSSNADYLTISSFSSSFVCHFRI